MEIFFDAAVELSPKGFLQAAYDKLRFRLIERSLLAALTPVLKKKKYGQVLAGCTPFLFLSLDDEACSVRDVMKKSDSGGRICLFSCKIERAIFGPLSVAQRVSLIRDVTESVLEAKIRGNVSKGALIAQMQKVTGKELDQFVKSFKRGPLSRSFDCTLIFGLQAVAAGRNPEDVLDELQALVQGAVSEFDGCVFGAGFSVDEIDVHVTLPRRIAKSRLFSVVEAAGLPAPLRMEH